MSIDVIIRGIRDRINHQNKNWLCIICGETGSGKSYSALAIAKLIDPSFNIDRVVFTPEELIRLLNSRKLHKGNVIMFDEAGVGIPAREWYSLSNKAINYIFQTFRHENLGVIFTTPSFDFIDSQTRKLFHTYIQTISVNFKEKVVESRWFNLQYNPRFGQMYYKHFRVATEQGIIIVDPIEISKPPEDLVEAYENKKRQFTKVLKKDVESDIRFARIKEEKKMITPEDIAKEILANEKKYVKTTAKGKKWVDVNLIELNFPVGRYRAMRSKKLVESVLNRQ